MPFSSLLHSLLLWALGCALLMYLGAPVLIFFSQRMPARREFETVDLASAPPEAASFLQSRVEEMEREGFSVVGHLTWPGQPNVRPFLTLYINRAAGDKAMAAVFYATANGVPRQTARFIEFTTRYQDGRSVDTTNNPAPGAFQPSPDHPTYRFPSVPDAHRLYALHRQMAGRFREGAGAEGVTWPPAPQQALSPYRSEHLSPVPNTDKLLPPPGQEAAQLLDATSEGYERQVRYGRLRPDPENSGYRPTWKGAFLMTWSQLWPVKHLRHVAGRRLEARLLHSLRDV